MTSFLDKSRTVAPAGFNRWLVPPAALAVHLSIGQIYAYSVFNAPLTKILGITAPAPGDWSLATVGWVFSIALAVLGASAALFGTWMERVGPRKAMFAAAVCFGLGFLVAALGVYRHNLWLLYLGNGVLGGVGLGLTQAGQLGGEVGVVVGQLDGVGQVRARRLPNAVGGHDPAELGVAAPEAA